MKLFLAVCWSIVLAGNIVECASGLTPSWFDVFCPGIVLAFDCWIDWLIERSDKRRNRKLPHDLDW